MDVEDLVKSPDKVNELLEVLDEIARDVSSYEYGLPMFDDGSKARLREAVYQWACGALTPQPTMETSPALSHECCLCTRKFQTVEGRDVHEVLCKADFS